MATKKQIHRAKIAAYRLAVAEHRVLRFGDTTFRSYPTVAACEIAFEQAQADGYPVFRP